MFKAHLLLFGGAPRLVRGLYRKDGVLYCEQVLGPGGSGRKEFPEGQVSHLGEVAVDGTITPSDLTSEEVLSGLGSERPFKSLRAGVVS